MISKKSPIDLRVNLKNNGVLVSADLVADIQLDLKGTADGVVVKSIKVGDGVSKVSDGVFNLSIAQADVNKLPRSGSAILDGILLPCNKAIIIRLGKIAG